MILMGATAAIAAVLVQLEAQDKLEGPYEKALGKLSIRFSLLHLTLEQFSWDVWGVKAPLASIITKDLTTKHLVEKLRASADIVIIPKEERTNFLSILRKIEKVAERRNELLHSIWIIKHGEPVLCVSKKRGRLVGPDAPSVEEINDLIRSIMQILGEFSSFTKERSLKGLFGLGLSLDEKRGGHTSSGAKAT
jgi:hypothetical protein